MNSLNLNEGGKFEDLAKYSSWDIIEFFRVGKIKLFADDLDQIQKCRCGKRAYYFWLQIIGREFFKADYKISFLCGDCYEMVKAQREKD